MPAPRAVLTDISNLGLDPKKSHSSLSKDGKLKKNSLPKKQDQDLKPGFVFMTAEKVSTNEVETLKQEKVSENVALDSNVEEESLTFDTNLEENVVDTSKSMVEEKIEKSKVDSALSYDQSEKQKKKQAYQKKSFSNNS